MTMEVEDYLEHFGRLGMKWGVRREQRKVSKLLETSGPGRSNKAREEAAKTLRRGAAVSVIAAAGAMFAGKLLRDKSLASLKAVTLR